MARGVVFTVIAAALCLCLGVAVPFVVADSVARSAAGPQGTTGPTGVAGPTGAPGARGALGTTGPVGEQGSTGAAGPVGAPGARGAAGTTGPNGVVGSQGIQGVPGATGPTGSQGTRGDAGADGAQGAVGDTGAIGPDGAAGAQGAAGSAGPLGAGGVWATSAEEKTVTITLSAGTWRVDAYTTISTNAQALITCVLEVDGQLIEVTRAEQGPTETQTYPASRVVVLSQQSDVTSTCVADNDSHIKSAAAILVGTVPTS